MTSRRAGEWVISFVAVYATGLIAFVLPGGSPHIALPFLPSGIAVAAVYRWGRRQWLPMFAAGVAIDLTMHLPLVAALGGGAGFAAGAMLASWLLNRSNFDAGFGRVRDVLAFLVAMLIGMAVVPSIGILGLLLAGIPPKVTEAVRWLRWWSDAAGGALLVSPSLLALSRQRLMRFKESWLDAVCWMLAVALNCLVIVIISGPAGRSIVVMAGFLIVFIGAIRFGVVVSSAGAVAISCTTAFSMAFRFGMFGQEDEIPGRLTLFLFSATLIAASLIVSVLLAERDAAALERRRAERQYAQIFHGSPQAIWVNDPIAKKFLLANEAAQRQYGWTLGEFLARDVSVLGPPGEPLVLPSHHQAGREDTVPIETRHITKDGRILEVEVWMRSIDLDGEPAELVFAVDVSERRALGRALVEGLAAEQRRIAGEIHDGLGQELTGLALSLRALATRAQRSSQAGAEELDALAKLAAHCIEGSKKIVQGLSPLDDAGGNLESALNALARRASLSGTPVRFQAIGATLESVRADALDHFYRIAQEAVQNALKHAAARAIDIELRTNQSDVRLSIVDDGRGLPGDLTEHPGLGMRTMQFRAVAIGGTLKVESLFGGGTAVRCAAPLMRAVARPS
jgi:PAS domain S-box-containing protein